jgi:tetratricopeptide (TPR) repeat protein
MSRCSTIRHLLSIILLAASLLMRAQGAGSNATSLLRDAGRAMADGDLVTAEEKLQWILRTSPDNYRALDLLGIVRAQQQRNSEAENIFQRVIKTKPDYASAHIDLGLLYVQMGEAEKAVAQLEEGLRLAPERTDATAALAGVLRDEARSVSAEDPEKALSLLLRARTLAPSQPNVLFDLGMVELRMSLFRDAVDTFQQTLKIRGDDAPATYGLGRALMELARFQDAHEQFVRYVAMRPDDASGHYALGMSSTALQLATEASSEFQKSIALQPVQTESYFRLGLLDLEAKDYGAAEQNFQHVLDRDAKHAGALAALGRAKLETKKFDEAVDLLQRAIASDSSLREAHYYLGLTYARMGRKEESDQQLQIATEMEKQATEKQRTVFKILDPGTNSAAGPK